MTLHWLREVWLIVTRRHRVFHPPCCSCPDEVEAPE